MLGCSCQLSSSIAQHFRTHSPPPRQRTAQLDGRAGEARPEEESLLSSGRFKFFPAAGHARSQLFCPPIPPNQLSRRKQVLCFFLDARKKRSPRILHPSLLPHPQSNALLQGWRRALLYCFLFMHIRKARAAVYDVCRPMCTARYSIRAHRSIGPRPSRTTPRFCASTQTSKSITALARPITGRG